MRNRAEDSTDYLTERDLHSETEIDEEGYTVYCKWGKKRRFRIQDPPALLPFGRPQWGKVVLAFVLLFCGVFFLGVGIKQTVSLKHLRETYVFFMMAGLVLLPGVYHVYIVVRIWMGSEGYHYDQLGTDE